MARTKKSNKKNDEAPKIIRNYDPMSLEKRLYDLDHAPQRSWDLYAMEKRLYDLEQGGSPTPPTPTNPGDLYIKNDDVNNITYVINDDNASFYFNGFTKESTDVVFPADFSNVIPREVTEMSKAYGPDKVTQIGWIGWHDGKIRAWSIDTNVTIGGTFWGVVIVGGGQFQNNEYTNPPERG